MKALLISFVVLCLFVLVAWFFTAQSHDTVASVEVVPEVVDPSWLQDEVPAVLPDAVVNQSISNAEPVRELSVAEQMVFILHDAHVASDQYLELVKLLGTNETEVLAYLAQKRYPEGMAVESAAYAEVEMISRAMLEFYGPQPLGQSLDTVEQLRPTGPLFSNVVSDLFLSGSGVESANIAYDWVMQNPDHPASLRSGATIGTILKDYTPEVAWEKATALPEGSIRARAFSAIVAESTEGDINAAIDLINSVEVTADLDDAISKTLSLGMRSGYAYEELVDIAASPVDPVYRSSSLTVLFQNWAMSDPASLEEWSQQTHEFPPEQLAEINLIMKQTLARHQVQH